MGNEHTQYVVVIVRTHTAIIDSYGHSCYKLYDLVFCVKHSEMGLHC